MNYKNPFADFFTQNDITKAFGNYQSFPFDMKELLEIQRKNFQAITEANQMAIENVQAIAQRQTQILSQIAEDHSNLTREMMADGTPEEKITKNAQLFKKAYQRTVSNMKDVSEMINKSSQDTGDLINKRVTASMNEIQESLERKKKAA